jgi:hypothetical protein
MTLVLVLFRSSSSSLFDAPGGGEGEDPEGEDPANLWMVGTRIVSSTSNVRASTICMNDVCYKRVAAFIKIYES